MIIRVLGIADPTPADLDVVYAGDDPPPDVLAALDATERLFVEAWLANRATAKLHRPGDGLAWDAEGLTPPDLPPQRGDNEV